MWWWSRTSSEIRIFLKRLQLVHGPSTKSRVAYILSLLSEPAANANESTVIEEEEDESDVEDGDITMLNTEVTFRSCKQKYLVDFLFL